LVSSSLERRATAAFQKLLLTGKLSAEDLAILKIPPRVSDQRLIERAFRCEEAFTLATFCEIGTGELTFDSLLKRIQCPDNKREPLGNKTFAAMVNSLYRLSLFADDLATYRRLSPQLRQIAQVPYYKSKAQWENIETQLLNEPKLSLNRLLMPAIQPCCEGVARAGALHQALRLGVATEKYQLHHGRLPARLEDLAPEFIPSVPTDPFDGKPMKMKRTKRGLVVYSVGPDGIDNGGTPIPPPSIGAKQTGDITFEVPERKP
jgi:hypothetical protein